MSHVFWGQSAGEDWISSTVAELFPLWLEVWNHKVPAHVYSMFGSFGSHSPYPPTLCHTEVSWLYKSYKCEGFLWRSLLCSAAKVGVIYHCVVVEEKKQKSCFGTPKTESTKVKGAQTHKSGISGWKTRSLAFPAPNIGHVWSSFCLFLVQDTWRLRLGIVKGERAGCNSPDRKCAKRENTCRNNKSRH